MPPHPCLLLAATHSDCRGEAEVGVEVLCALDSLLRVAEVPRDVEVLVRQVLHVAVKRLHSLVRAQ